MSKCLVTGRAGFIGSNLVDKLIEQGHKVVVIDNLSSGEKENSNSKAKFYNFDIQNPKFFQVFKKEKPDIVFHYAAQINVRKSVENPVESAKTNILGSLNILENRRNFGVKKIIFASSEKLNETFSSKVQEIHGSVKVGEQKRGCLDFKKSEKKLDWAAKYDLENGLENTLLRFKSHER